MQQQKLLNILIKKVIQKVNFDTTDASKAIDNLNSKIQKLKSKKLLLL